MPREPPKEYNNSLEKPQAEPTPTGIRILAMYEGSKTEPGYFQCFAKENSIGQVDPINLRHGFETDNTDRLSMVHSANDRYLYKRGILKVREAVSLICEEYYKKAKDNSKNEKSLRMTIQKFRNYEYGKKKSEWISKGWVNKDELVTDPAPLATEIKNDLKKLCEDNDDLTYFEPSIKVLTKTPPHEQNHNDYYYVIYDRDVWSREEQVKYGIKQEHMDKQTNKRYITCKLECHEDIKILLTTPLFEYWLLLHSPDKDYLDVKHTLSSKATIYRRLLLYENDLEYRDDWSDKIVEDYYDRNYKTMDSTRYRAFYKNTLNDAIKRSKNPRLARDYEKLLDHTGTMIGDELERLLDLKHDRLFHSR